MIREPDIKVRRDKSGLWVASCGRFKEEDVSAHGAFMKLWRKLKANPKKRRPKRVPA